MIIEAADVVASLRELGLSAEDILMLHVDAGVVAQMSGTSRVDKLNCFIDVLKEYFSNGTLLVPSFTYSATKNELFDPKTTPSAVGLFSEFFRTSVDVERTAHPIFSFSAWGKNQQRFLNTTNETCFGAGSVFDEFYHAGGKIVCIGCSFDRVTFVHYVEQKIGVQYRYLKKFPATILVDGSEQSFETSYFVRDLSMNFTSDLRALKNAGISRGCLRETLFGRFALLSISAKDFFSIASSLYNDNPNALIQIGQSNA